MANSKDDAVAAMLEEGWPYDDPSCGRAPQRASSGSEDGLASGSCGVLISWARTAKPSQAVRWTVVFSEQRLLGSREGATNAAELSDVQRCPALSNKSVHCSNDMPPFGQVCPATKKETRCCRGPLSSRGAPRST